MQGCLCRAIMMLTMSHRFQQFLFSGFLALSMAVSNAPAQTKDAKPGKESEPPEEDEGAKPKEYAFNPLQAEHELQVGEFYLKKGSYQSAVARFIEATKWNPTLAEAYLRLGDAETKFKDMKAAKEAYSKYLQLAPDGKSAAQVKKKLEKM